jgi:integrase
MIVNLTSIVPERLFCPEGKRHIEYVDKGGTGLYVEVRATSSGQGTYFLRYKDANGKTCHQKIGRTTDIDLDEARRRAKTLKAEITLGKDPRADEKARKAVPTFSAMFQEYMKHAKVHNRGWKKKSQMYDLRIKEVFGNKRLDQITRREISSWHVGLREDGLSPAYSDRFLALLRHVLNMAVEWEMLEKNPATGVKLFNVDNRVEQYLNEDELKRLLKVLQTDKNRTVCLIVLFLLATGVRLQEGMQARWVDIDRDNKVWRIPAANAKSKHSRLAVLNTFVFKNVIDQLDTDGKYEHLFINRKTGKPFVSIAKSWDRLRCDATLPGFKLHSLRRTHASYVVNNGHSLLLASRLLGHTDPSITAKHYAVVANDSLRAASESVASVINQSMPKPS